MHYSYYEIEKLVQLHLEDIMQKAKHKHQLQIIRNRKKEKKPFSLFYFTSIIDNLRR